MPIDCFTMTSRLAVENKLSKPMLLCVRKIQSNIPNAFALKNVWSGSEKDERFTWT